MGADREHRQPRVIDALLERPGEQQVCELALAVGRRRGIALGPLQIVEADAAQMMGVAADGHDARPVRGAQVREEFPGPSEMTEMVRPELELESVLSHGVGRDHDARVVDEEIDARLRLAHLLLAAAGALGAHVLGYFLADVYQSAAIDASNGHAYLSGAAHWVGISGALALVWLAVRGGRAVGVGSVLRVRTLLSLQVLLYGAQESLERLAAGHSLVELLTEPAVLLGLAFQPLLALALVALVRLGARLVEAVLAAPRPRRDTVALISRAPLVGPAPLLLPALSRRGPPVRRR